MEPHSDKGAGTPEEPTEKRVDGDSADSLLAGDTLPPTHDDLQVMVDSAAKDSGDDTGSSDSNAGLTFRVLVLGTVFSSALAFVNMYYWFRSNPISVGIAAVQLLSLPAGWALSRVLPERRFNTFGMRWTMNPGRFSMAEHVLISVFANASTGTAYALDIVVVRRLWIGPPLSFGASVLTALTSQLVGYSFSGLFHRFLVEPDAMVWPSTLASVMLFRALQSMVPGGGGGGERPGGVQGARLRVFWMAFAASFAWYFVPGWAFPTLTMVPILCLAAPNNIYANQLGDGYNGLGMLALTLDWSTISNAYTGSPLATPWFAACNVLAGFVLVMWVITPIGYYANAWGAQTLPIYTNSLFDAGGSVYNVSRVLKDGHLDTAAYAEYGPMRMSFQFLLMYGFCFMGIACLLSHVALHHGADIWRTVRQIHADLRRDVQRNARRLPSDAPGVPTAWYAAVFVATLAMGVAACRVFDLLPWYGFLLAIGMACVLTLPVGVVEAVSNFQYALGVMTELVAGFLWPGQPTYNASFKMFGYITMKQALLLARDQKLGRYLRVPPRHLFVCQVLGTVVAVFVQLGTAFWLMDSVAAICTDAAFPFTCRQGKLFYSTMVIWGVFGPQRQFGGRYSVLYWMFLVGAALPLPFWLLRRRFPRSAWRLVNIPVALTFIGYMPNAPTHDFVMFSAVCFVFNYVLLRRRSAWWRRYTFTLSAALDAGLAVSGIVGYFALQTTVTLDWWGTRNHCPLSQDPLSEHPVGQPDVAAHCGLELHVVGRVGVPCIVAVLGQIHLVDDVVVDAVVLRPLARLCQEVSVPGLAEDRLLLERPLQNVIHELAIAAAGSLQQRVGEQLHATRNRYACVASRLEHADKPQHLAANDASISISRRTLCRRGDRTAGVCANRADATIVWSPASPSLRLATWSTACVPGFSNVTPNCAASFLWKSDVSGDAARTRFPPSSTKRVKSLIVSPEPNLFEPGDSSMAWSYARTPSTCSATDAF
ncbi:hypothetical protein EV175_004507, partial [Coemansia sp. RSA 1933]